MVSRYDIVDTLISKSAGSLSVHLRLRVLLNGLQKAHCRLVPARQAVLEVHCFLNFHYIVIMDNYWYYIVAVLVVGFKFERSIQQLVWLAGTSCWAWVMMLNQPLGLHFNGITTVPGFCCNLEGGKATLGLHCLGTHFFSRAIGFQLGTFLRVRPQAVCEQIMPLASLKLCRKSSKFWV